MKENLVSQLAGSVVIAAFLPPLLMFIIKQRWEENIKKLLATLACFLVAVGLAWLNDQLVLDMKNSKLLATNMILLMTVSSQLYDKFWKPLANTIADKTPLKFVRQGNPITYAAKNPTQGDG